MGAIVLRVSRESLGNLGVRTYEERIYIKRSERRRGERGGEERARFVPELAIPKSPPINRTMIIVANSNILR